ncbi:Permease [Klebsiella variicola]|uniref:Permease n=1 Tax=Klebsiella variicola TaxID=244366 RepID=A0A7H4MC88_KLEVA|nr:Permease [Klebsiella variicola]
MKTAIPLVLLTMAIGEWVAPQGEQMARNYRAQQMYGGSLLSTQQGLWAKDGHNFVYIERVKGNDELGGVQHLCLQSGASFRVGALCRLGKVR